MIKTNNGGTCINGSLAELLADYTLITKALYEALTGDAEMSVSEEKAKQLIRGAMENGLMDEDALDEKIAKLAKEFKDKMGERLGEVLLGAIKEICKKEHEEEE